MKKALFIPVLFFLFSSCNDNKSAYIKYLKSNLKDPESLVIYKEEIVDKKDKTVIVKVDYGAKNSYGGMERETYYFRIIDGIVSKAQDESMYKLEKYKNETSRERYDAEKADTEKKLKEYKTKDSIENSNVPMYLKRP